MNKINPLQNAAFRRAVPRESLFLKTGMILMFMMSLIGAVSAQTSTTGQITGNITDQSGAAVPDATIKVTRTDTGETRTVTTSDDGNYTVPNLSVGTYRITVSKSGFKESAVGSVIVNVANVTRQNVALEVGQISQTVEITADAIQVQTETAAVGEVVSGEQVRELPLNGRSFVQLTQLQPGVAPANGQDNKSKGLFGGVDFSVNGNSAQSNLFLTDGANNNDTGSNRTILLFPSIEAIAEFKSLRNSYGPEYGQAAGAVISIVTRGGSNEFHGSAFYFGRNDALNAAEFFAKTRTGIKDKLRRNDYGFSLGGPILKNRLFFFYSQEWNKEIRGQSRFGRVPTNLERAGDFRESLPGSPLYRGSACALNLIGGSRPGSDTQIIPQAQISAAGQALIQIFPTANRPFDSNCNNWAISANSPINFREENGRIDYNLSKNNRIFGRFTRDDWSNAFPILQGNLWGDDAFPAIESSWAQPSQQLAVKLSTTLGQSAINEIQFSYSNNRINITHRIRRGY